MSKMRRNKPVGFDKENKIDINVLKRLLSYITEPYKLRFICVIIFILISSVVGVISSLFIFSLVLLGT